LNEEILEETYEKKAKILLENKNLLEIFIKKMIIGGEISITESSQDILEMIYHPLIQLLLEFPEQTSSTRDSYFSGLQQWKENGFGGHHWEYVDLSNEELYVVRYLKAIVEYLTAHSDSLFKQEIEF